MKFVKLQMIICLLLLLFKSHIEILQILKLLKNMEYSWNFRTSSDFPSKAGCFSLRIPSIFTICNLSFSTSYLQTLFLNRILVGKFKNISLKNKRHHCFSQAFTVVLPTIVCSKHSLTSYITAVNFFFLRLTILFMML